MGIPNLSYQFPVQMAVAAGATAPDPGGTAARGAQLWSTTTNSLLTWTGTAWAAPAAGGGSGNAVQATLNFGTAPATDAKVVVTGQSWVTGSSVVTASLAPHATDHPSGEEPALEEISLAVADLVAGTGFTVYAHAPRGTHGRYLVNCTGV